MFASWLQAFAYLHIANGDEKKYESGSDKNHV